MVEELDWFWVIWGFFLVWTVSVLTLSCTELSYRYKFVDSYQEVSGILISIIAFVGVAFSCSLGGGM